MKPSFQHNAHDSAETLPAISSSRELGANEALWLEKGTSFRRLARRFHDNPGALPSSFVSPEQAEAALERVRSYASNGADTFDICINGMPEYPKQLRDAQFPVEVLYYQGQLNLVESPSVAVIGTRKPTDAGRQHARLLATKLVEHGYTVISGLAAGIDTEAHTAAIQANGRTIAVLGTPIIRSYPPENAELQAFIATHHLVVSQVPILRYEAQTRKINRFFFPARNITMSAVSLATVIVEASEISGTLVQAREALRQRRKLIILDSCFENTALTWPERFPQQGAIRLKRFEDIQQCLSAVEGTHIRVCKVCI